MAFSGFVMLAVISLVGVLLPLWLIAESGNAPAFVTPSFLFRLHAILLVAFGVFLWHALFPESVTINDRDRSGVLKDVPTEEPGGRLDGLDKFALGLFSVFFAADLLITGPNGLESMLRSFWIIGLIGVVALTPRYFFRRRRLLARLRAFPATPDKP